MSELTERIKKKARELGFDAVGIAPAAPLDLAERAIRERVSLGLLRDYGFARRPADSMTHPENLLPDARSVIVVALSYLAPEPEPQPGGPRGRIARFARGRDYHIVVEERLRELGEWLIGQSGGGAYRICVDTGPIIDRAIAREAGVGSYGRNASIVTREAGSWVVLGELVTDIELEPDEPAALDGCDDCLICAKACPSGAIIFDRPGCPSRSGSGGRPSAMIDQTKCISHLTQMKGSIPRELRSLIGDRIYGCDVCQEVCRRNLNVRPGKGLPDAGGLGARPELIPLANITEEHFDRVVGPTAIAWIGRTRFRRNVIVALGNIGDARAMPELTKALADGDPIIREHAAWALEQTTEGSPNP